MKTLSLVSFLVPVLTSIKDELCIQCGNPARLERVWLAQIDLHRSDNSSSEQFSEYICPHCGYHGEHDYPFFVWRGALPGPGIAFVASAEYARRKPSARQTKFGRLAARLMGPFRHNANFSLKQCAENLGPTRLLAFNSMQPAAREILRDFEIAIGIRMALHSVLEPIVLPDLTANAICDAWQSNLNQNTIIPTDADNAEPVAEALGEVLFLLKAYEVLETFIGQNDYSAVTRICCQTLSKAYCRDHTELLLPFSLNLAWACALSSDACAMVDPSEALAKIEAAISTLRGRDEPARLANALRNLATCQHNLGEGPPEVAFAKAEQLYDEAISLFLSLGDDHASDAAQTILHRSADIRRRPIGDKAQNVESAIEAAELARGIFVLRGDVCGEAKAHNYLGTAFINRAIGLPKLNWETARGHFIRAYDLWSSVCDRGAMIEESICLATVELELGRMDSDSERIRAGFERINTTAEEARTRRPELYVFAMEELLVAYGYLLATTAPRAEIFEEALQQCNATESAMRQNSLSHRLVFVATHRAEISVGWAVANPDEESICRAGEAIATASACWCALGNPSQTTQLKLTLTRILLRAGRLNEALEICQGAANDTWCFGRLGISLSSRARLSEQLYSSHLLLAYILARSGRLQDALGALDRALTPTLRHRKQKYEDPALSECWRDYWDLMGKLEIGNKDTSFRGNAAIIAKIKDLWNVLQSSNSTDPEDGLSALADEVLLNLLPSGGALVAPVYADNEACLIICISNLPHGLDFTTVACAEFTGFAIDEAISDTPGCPGVFDFIQAEVMSPRGSEDDRFFRLCGWLGKTFATKLTKHLISIGVKPQASLLFLNHGKLTYFPFHAAEIEHDGVENILGAVFPITYVPSLHWLNSLSPGRVTSVPKKELLIVSDSLADLPGALIEGRYVARLACTHHAVALTQGQVAKDCVLAHLTQADVVHVAGHSEFNLDNPFQSSIQLADETLTVASLIALVDAAPSVVVLSSCSSGQCVGIQEAGDNWGLMLALHAWGVHTVISCLWPVNDLAMLLFFSEFYRSGVWRTEPAKAVSHAQTSLRKISMREAELKIKEACNGDREALDTLLSQLRGMAKFSGPDAPFSHPLYWGATVATGSPVPR